MTFSSNRKKTTAMKTTTSTSTCILGLLFVLWLWQSLYLVSNTVSLENTPFLNGSKSTATVSVSSLRNKQDSTTALSTTVGIVDPAFPVSATTTTSTLPYKYNNTAYRLLQQYKKWHSEETLQKELAAVSQGPRHLAPERRYAIGYYSCPLQAGNRMGAFVEAMVWSMITNRTLLWKYYTQDDCNVVGKDFNAIVCDHANSEPDCAKVLQRASFLPSYDAWKDRLGGLAGSEEEPTVLRHYALFPLYQKKAAQKNRYWYKDAYQDNGLADTISDKLIVFPIAFFNTIPKWDVQSEKELFALLKTPSARQRARQLRQTDIYYAYALFLFEAFSIQPQYQVPPQFPQDSLSVWNRNGAKAVSDPQKQQRPYWMDWETSMVPDPTRHGITIVVHSRHIKQDNDGSNITNELSLLEPLLWNATLSTSSTPTSSSFCQVILLSDRIPTIQNLQHYLQTTFPHCFIGLAPHDTGTSFESEHGPFAGVGFYQDLSFVHHQIQYVPTTRTVFLGSTTRSSGQLVMTTMIHAMYQQEQYNNRHNDVGDLPSLQPRPPYLEAINLDNNS